MSKNEIVLNITGKQITSEGETQNTELITEGKLYNLKGKLVIEYEDTQIVGIVGTRTTIIPSDTGVIFEKTNDSDVEKSWMVFEKGKKYINFYETPIGNIELGILPSEVNCEIKEDKGFIDLQYELHVAGQYATTNELHLSYNNS